MTGNSLVLLTGPTGCIGGRLRPLLERAGHRVRCLARSPEVLRGQVAPSTEIVRADVLEPASLRAALAQVHTAYYLVHCLGSVGAFEQQDRQGARNFAEAARSAGVARIVYLGGLGELATDLSPHLRSRQEVGRLLASTGIPVIEFRASIVIGSGSASFELIRALMERLPVMTTPRWVATPAQPIDLEDAVAYLLAALDLPPGESRVFEIGGTDRVSYGDIMREYARQRGLRRLLIPLPGFTPSLCGLWLRLVVPKYARVGRRLVESLRSPTVVRDDAALRTIEIEPVGMSQAIARALQSEAREPAHARSSRARSSGAATGPWDGVRIGARTVDSGS